MRKGLYSAKLIVISRWPTAWRKDPGKLAALDEELEKLEKERERLSLLTSSQVRRRRNDY